MLTYSLCFHNSFHILMTFSRFLRKYQCRFSVPRGHSGAFLSLKVMAAVGLLAQPSFGLRIDGLWFIGSGRRSWGGNGHDLSPAG